MLGVDGSQWLSRQMELTLDNITCYNVLFQTAALRGRSRAIFWDGIKRVARIDFTDPGQDTDGGKLSSSLSDEYPDTAIWQCQSTEPPQQQLECH